MAGDNSMHSVAIITIMVLAVTEILIEGFSEFHGYVLNQADLLDFID
jgi:hypothetical protein